MPIPSQLRTISAVAIPANPAEIETITGLITFGRTWMAKMRKVKVVPGYGKFTGSNTLDVEGADGTTTITFDDLGG